MEALLFYVLRVPGRLRTDERDTLRYESVQRNVSETAAAAGDFCFLYFLHTEVLRAHYLHFGYIIRRHRGAKVGCK
jgi:hypothetical protein